MDKTQLATIFAGVAATGILAVFTVIFYGGIRDNRVTGSKNSEAISKLSTQVDSLMHLPGEMNELRVAFNKLHVAFIESHIPVTEGKSPISLNATGQKLADALNVAEFIKDNYDLIVANRPDDSNKLDIQGWSQSGDAAQVMREILGDDGANNIKNVIFDEGLELDSDIAVEYIVRQVYGIVLRDTIFERELK